MAWPLGRKRMHDGPEIGLDGDEFVIIVDPTLDSKLVVYHEPRSYPAEQYRSFRTNLCALNPKDAPRTLLFTSAIPDEGKSTTVANIALSLAEFDHLNVCLIDMDLRAPHMHELFGLPQEPGICDILLDRKDPRRATHSGGVPNLSIITAGRHTNRPAEVMGSDYIQDLVSYLKRDFNYVVFDTPPCAVFPDASEMSKFMDGVIMVVSLRDTSRLEADEALAGLRSAGANVIGTFVTGTAIDEPTVVADLGEV